MTEIYVTVGLCLIAFGIFLVIDTRMKKLRRKYLDETDSQEG